MTPDNRLGAPRHTTEGDPGYRHSNPSKPMRTWGAWFRDLYATDFDSVVDLLNEEMGVRK